MVAKSDKPLKGWLKPCKSWDVYTTYQLVIRISLHHPLYLQVSCGLYKPQCHPATCNRRSRRNWAPNSAVPPDSVWPPCWTMREDTCAYWLLVWNMFCIFSSEFHHHMVAGWWFGTFLIVPFSWEEWSQLTYLACGAKQTTKLASKLGKAEEKPASW